MNLGLYKLSPRLAERLCLEAYWDPDRPREVPWAIGAFLCVRRHAFDEVGGFDEDQWMYAEDLDLGWRLDARGWTTRYVPLARVRHEAGAATTAAFGDEKTERFMAATNTATRRRLGPTRARIIGWLGVAGAAARLAWMTPLAAISPRWSHRRDANRRWLHANRRALRSAGHDGRPRS